MQFSDMLSGQPIKLEVKMKYTAHKREECVSPMFKDDLSHSSFLPSGLNHYQYIDKLVEKPIIEKRPVIERQAKVKPKHNLQMYDWQ